MKSRFYIPIILVFTFLLTAGTTYAQQPVKKKQTKVPKPKKQSSRDTIYPTPPPPPPLPPPPPPVVLTPETATNTTAQLQSLKQTKMEYNVTMKYLAGGSFFTGNADADFTTTIKIAYQQLEKLALHEKVWSTKDSIRSAAGKMTEWELGKEVAVLKESASKASDVKDEVFRQEAMRLISETVRQGNEVAEPTLEKQMGAQAKLIKELSAAYLKSGTDPVLVSFAKKTITQVNALSK